MNKKNETKIFYNQVLDLNPLKKIQLSNLHTNKNISSSI